MTTLTLTSVAIFGFIFGILIQSLKSKNKKYEKEMDDLFDAYVNKKIKK